MGLKVSGFDEAATEAGEIADRVASLAPVLNDAAAMLKRFIEERFEARTSPTGRDWLPVTLNTELYRETDGRGLMRSRFASVRLESVSYGAKASFADVHQLGDGRVPARPFAPREGDGGPADELVEEIAAKIREHIRPER